MLNAQSSSLLSPPLPSFVVSPASDTEQDAAVKLDQERAEIVAKYDKVRQTLPSVSVKAHRSFGEAENLQQLLFFPPSCGHPKPNSSHSVMLRLHQTS